VSVEPAGGVSIPTHTSTRESAVKADGAGCKGESAVEHDAAASSESACKRDYMGKGIKCGPYVCYTLKKNNS